MLCEKCAREVDLVICGGCGRSVELLGPFCYQCGRKIGKEAAQEARTGESDQEIDLSGRILCRDGTCIGVIGEQGTCKICGKPYAPES
ncbi:MAG: hypothetical protein ABSE25_03640 [Syntrophorhabdales bacterium]|jgi:hypothetical protein